MNEYSKGLKRHVFKKYIAVALFALTAMTASGETVEPGVYTMVVIEDRAFGRTIESGRYSEAIERLENRNSVHSKRFSINNNLCVALVLSGRNDEAVVHCDRAVDSKAHSPKRHRFWSDSNDDWATALSNRGVLKVLMGDAQGARSDFENAVKLDTGLNHPTGNLAKLESTIVGANASLVSR